jgi:hypothetical protein
MDEDFCRFARKRMEVMPFKATEYALYFPQFTPKI